MSDPIGGEHLDKVEWSGRLTRDHNAFGLSPTIADGSPQGRSRPANAVGVGVGTRLAGRYEACRRLGAGGAADVWLMRDRTLQRLVAVKVLRGATAQDQQRFRTEIRAQAPLTHRALVHVLDTGIHQGMQFLVLTYIDGATLAKRLTHGPLSPQQVARLGRRIAGALAHAHEHGVIHRDVKPSNVIFDTLGDAFLADFGVARLTDSERLTRTDALVGTAAYGAPEQVCGQPVTPAADVYALGLVLLEAFTGRQEYTGTVLQAAVARLLRPPNVPIGLSPPWPQLLARMLTDEPTARPTAADVAADLRRSASLTEMGARVSGRAQSVSRTITPAPAAVSSPHRFHIRQTWGQQGEQPGARPVERSKDRRQRRPLRASALAVAVALVVIAALAMVPTPTVELPRDAPASLDEALDRLEAAIGP